jgi:hypothetical protein
VVFFLDLRPSEKAPGYHEQVLAFSGNQSGMVWTRFAIFSASLIYASCQNNNISLTEIP